MIRGVNRRVIEVSECKSKFFERAIFFVRPDAPNRSEAALKNEADSILSALERPPVQARQKRYRISRRALWLFVWLSGGLSAVMAVLSLIG